MKSLSSNRRGILTKDRRDFLKKSGSLAIMSSLGLSFFTACSEEGEPEPYNTNTNNPTPPNNNGDGSGNSSGISINGNEITIDLGVVTELQSVGGWLLIAEAQTLVINDGQIKALTSICTHSGCDRDWQVENGNFICTCHGSVFTSDGAVVNGPASSPLTQFSVTTDRETVTITK